MQVMPIKTEGRAVLTPKERAELDWEKESAHLQVDYANRANEAKIELEKTKAEHDRQIRELEVDIKRLEAKWIAMLKIPLNIVLLPTKLIMALAIPISAISGKQLDRHFWEIMKW